MAEITLRQVAKTYFSAVPVRALDSAGQGRLARAPGSPVLWPR